ncbi:unnamed protein product, partial [marine sediment metagenome]
DRTWRRCRDLLKNAGWMGKAGSWSYWKYLRCNRRWERLPEDIQLLN